MALRTRFAPLLLVSTLLSSQWLYTQESTVIKVRGTSPAQADEANAKPRHYCEVPSCTVKVLYFANLSQPSELQDVVNAVRSIAEIQRVQQILASQVIIVEGNADQVALAEKLAFEIDKSKRRFGGLGYRLDVKIQEADGDKKPHADSYSLVTDVGQSAKVSIGGPAPPRPQSEAGSEAKQPPPDPGNTRSIECRILLQNDRTIELTVDAEFAGDPTREPGSSTPPLLRSRVHATVELDKPTVIARIDDPESGHSFTVELTATRLREKS